ncbi:MAG: TatD family hydrolase [Pseudomonadota bacterium]
MPNYIDTHSHITFPDFDKDRDQVLKRAWDAGLDYIITVGVGNGVRGNLSAVELAKSYDKLFATSFLYSQYTPIV